MIDTEVSAVGVVFKLSAMECLKKVSLVKISICLSNSLKTQIDYKAFRFCLASEYSTQVIKTLSLSALVCFIVFLLFVYEKKEGV